MTGELALGRWCVRVDDPELASEEWRLCRFLFCFVNVKVSGGVDGTLSLSTMFLARWQRVTWESTVRVLDAAVLRRVMGGMYCASSRSCLIVSICSLI